jgi:AraC-like DNA-binding protein
MQATLARHEIENQTDDVLGKIVPFSGVSRVGDQLANRDDSFQTKNLFAVHNRNAGNANDRALIEAMVHSVIYQDYEQAFSEATGLPVALRPVDGNNESPFRDAAVPVRVGDRVIGFLQSEPQENYFGARVVSQKQHDSAIKLLSIFAQHLSLLSNQMVVKQEHSEPPVITRAKEYIHEHQTEEISLGQVAKAVNTSTFYFCKMFKKFTGINFTDYLSRVRIEKSRNLLLNPNLRVSEIAFEVGFQSLTHFNRVFKRILGQSPTQYRAQLLGH